MSKQIRILSETTIGDSTYRPNQVVEVENSVAKPILAAGAADDNAEAVAYALALPGNALIVHGAAGQSAVDDVQQPA